LERPEFNFVSLQVGPARFQIQNTPDLTDLGKHFTSFTDFAKAIIKLDLLVTADKAITHLAGAMGCPC
jgi:ADP-heptose:LPS heptosyltransferase